MNIWLIVILMVMTISHSAGQRGRQKPYRGPGWRALAGLPPADFHYASNKIRQIKKLRARRFGIFLQDWQIPYNNRIGDIAFTPSQADSAYYSELSQRRRKRKIYAPPGPHGEFTKWPISIKYSIRVAEFTTAAQNSIRLAFQRWQAITCLTFIDVTGTGSTDPHLDIMNDGSGSCYSYLGMAYSGAQPMQLASWCTDWIGYAMHEIGHALLLYHEHMRVDRDPYITVITANINAIYLDQFTMVTEPTLYNDVIPFDCGSVMIYSSRAGSTNGLRVIETVNPLNQQMLGQPIAPSFFDAKAVNLLYCGSTCTPLSCLQTGYADPASCSICRCPEGFGGSTCTQPATSTAGCSPAGGVIHVTTPNQEMCITSPNYGPSTTYSSGAYCVWHLKASGGGTISVRFDGTFGVLCRDNVETCAHWVEIKNVPGQLYLRGPRFCCIGTPSAVLTANTEMMIIFDARYTEIPSSAPSNPSNFRGFKLCYKLLPTITTPTTTTTTTTTPGPGPGPCGSNPCLYGQPCLTFWSSYYCWCLNGGSQPNCQIGPTTTTTPATTTTTTTTPTTLSPRDPCNPNPCSVGRICIHYFSTYYCW